MKIQAPVKQETKKIAVGAAILSLVMIAVFIAIGYFDVTVVWGTLLGAGFAVFNFFLMAMTVQRAADQMNGVQLPAKEETETETQDAQKKEELPEQKAARSIVQRSYYLRMALMAVVIVIAVKMPVFNAIPTVIALFFPRIVITLQPLLQKMKKGE